MSLRRSRDVFFKICLLGLCLPEIFCCPTLPSGNCFVDCTAQHYAVVCEDVTSKVLHDDLMYLAGLGTPIRLSIWNSAAVTRLGAAIFTAASKLIISLEIQNMPNLVTMIELDDMSALRVFIIRNAPLLRAFPLELLPSSLETIILDRTGIQRFLKGSWFDVLLDGGPISKLNLSAVHEFSILNQEVHFLSEFFTSFVNIQSITVKNCITNIPRASEVSKPFLTVKPIRSLQLINNTYIHPDPHFGEIMMQALFRSLSLQPNGTLQINENDLRIDKDATELLKTRSSLTSLSLRDTRFGFFSFVERPFENFADLQTLDLGNTQFPSLRDGMFAGLPKLRVLKIDHNDLRSLGAVDLFSGLQAANLSVLDMSDTAVRYLPLGMATAGQHLTELYLARNYLGSEDLEEAAGKGWLSHVRVLDLSGNRMTTFSGWSLRSMKILHTLDISCNRFTNITEQYFSGLPEKMLLLNLSFCAAAITDRPEVSKTAFRTFPLVKNLYFGSGLFRKWIFQRLQQMSAKSLAYLEELHLPNNKISYLYNSSSFEGFTGLKYLDLRQNTLQSIGRGTFSTLPSLRRLNLAGNALFSIEVGSFEGLPNLDYLDISANNLEFIEQGALDTSPSLRGLFMANNRFLDVHKLFDQGGLQLEHLSIANLNISCLDPALFSRFKKIKWIYLNDSLSIFMDFPPGETLQQQVAKTGVHIWSRIQYCDEPWDVYQEKMVRADGGSTFFRVALVDPSTTIHQNILANFPTCYRPGPRRIKEAVASLVCSKPAST